MIYRYFPEPDLVELRTSEDFVNDIRNSLPELPKDRRNRYSNELKLGDEAVTFSDVGSNGRRLL